MLKVLGLILLSALMTGCFSEFPQPKQETGNRSSIVINNQPRTSTIIISNQLSDQQKAFKHFKIQFNSLNNLLETSDNKVYFKSISLDKQNPNTVILETTQAWKNAPKATQQSILHNLNQIWQETLGSKKGVVIQASGTMSSTR